MYKLCKILNKQNILYTDAWNYTINQLQKYQIIQLQNHFGGLLHIGEILQKEALKNVATTDEEI